MGVAKAAHFSSNIHVFLLSQYQSPCIASYKGSPVDSLVNRSGQVLRRSFLENILKKAYSIKKACPFALGPSSFLLLGT